MSSTASMAKRSFLLRRSMVGSDAGGTKAGRATAALRQGCDAPPSNAADRRDHQLGDALAAGDGDAVAAEIGKDDADLAAVIRIDRARAVEHGDAGAERQARARPHLSLITLRQGERDPR